MTPIKLGITDNAVAPPKAQFIDLTPTWVGLVPLLVTLIENGDAQGRRTAIEEMTRMAAAADRLVESTRS